MSLLFRVITAAHARGTHHRLALDGVQRLAGPNAEKWQRVLLAHAAQLVLGSKAPDDEFKDFQNHVLHPRDNFWGGAPDKARSWYGELVESLTRADWAAAAWCAGVLSHYVTDPINPFHTAQSEAENAIHRAFEWSVSKSYRDLSTARVAGNAPALNISDDPAWLEQLISTAAEEANQHYEKLIAHYDIHRGVVDPPSGLDVVSKKIVGEMLDLSVTVFAAVLERALAESKMEPPDVSLTVDMILATLRIPYNVFLKRMEDGRERAVVEAIYDELVATGKVDKNLPEDDRVVRDRFAAEVLSKRTVADKTARFPAKGSKPEETEAERVEKLKRVGARGIPQPGPAKSAVAPLGRSDKELPIAESPRPAPVAADQAQPAGPVSRFKGEAAAVAVATAASEITAEPATASDVQAAAPVPIAAVVEETPVQTAAPVEAVTAERLLLAAAPVALAALGGTAAKPQSKPMSAGQARIYLSADQDIVDAPSIGPKMAERLRPIGLRTVGDLLLADPKVVAGKLGHSEVDADTVRDWQDQARLVCLIPGLRGTHAQLLVGAEFRTASSIAACEADELCARVLAFATSTAGQRVLRNAEPPDLEKIKSWLDGARLAQAA